MHLRITTETPLDEPTADGGFISWLRVEVLDRDDKDQEVVVGRVRAAIVHASVAGGELYDAMDADSGELEAVYATYFEDNELREEFREGFGPDLLYLSDVEIDDAGRERNVDLAVARRLCDTLGTGCELVVVACDGEAEATRWATMGFAKTRGARGLMHLHQAYEQPGIVAAGDGYAVKPLLSAERRRRMN